MLWFDVERGYKTTLPWLSRCGYQLWFDVERGYKTTISHTITTHGSCGLM